jgi:putative transcriptional regulator
MAGRGKSKSVSESIRDGLKEFVGALESGGDLRQRFTCRTVRLNVEPQTYSPALVKKTRGMLGASQEIFARFLGVSASAVQDWEQGAKPPTGSSRRLMDEIRNNPDYWKRRLQELATPIKA